MITLPIYTIPFVYTSVFLAVVLAIWLLYVWRRERRRRAMWQGLSQCRLCAEWLRHGRQTALFRCPACGAVNESNFINDI